MTDKLAHARDLAIVASMPLLFASNLVIGRAAIDSVEPWMLAFLRWGGAFLLLVPIWASTARHRRAISHAAPRVVLLGFLGLWICGGLVYLALRYTTATNATLIYATAPIMIVALERILRTRAVTSLQWLGMVVAFAGVAVVVLRGEWAALAALSFNVGDVIMLGCALAWAFYSVLLKDARLETLPTGVLFTGVVAAGTVLLAPAALLEALVVGVGPFTAEAWVSVLALAVIPSVLAFSSYQHGVKRLGASVTGLFMYLLPAYGVALAVVFLGERLHVYHLVGMALIIAGVVLASRTRETAWKPP